VGKGTVKSILKKKKASLQRYRGIGGDALIVSLRGVASPPTKEGKEGAWQTGRGRTGTF